MNVIAWASVALIVVPIAFMAWAFISVDRTGLATVRTNLSRSAGMATDLGAQPSAFNLQRVGAKLTPPKGYTIWLDKLLAKLGRPAGMPLGRLLILKPALALAAGLVGLLFFLRAPSGQGFLLYLAAVLLVYFIPDLIIHGRAAERQKAIQTELPNTLDQMLISVEAGLGFEGGHGPGRAEWFGTAGHGNAPNTAGHAGGTQPQGSIRGVGRTCGCPRPQGIRRGHSAGRYLWDRHSQRPADPSQANAYQASPKGRRAGNEAARQSFVPPLMFCILPVLFIVIMVRPSSM